MMSAVLLAMCLNAIRLNTLADIGLTRPVARLLLLAVIKGKD
ncbi:MAG: hypothetical protein PHC60_06740 [Heliobacteriaceae bacterium]|nr:hypothetical protein [Heliobacteriaceae bacterium]MDD4588065.1 hypothetical protein [Heliobacteriaceae bacterium]